MFLSKFCLLLLPLSLFIVSTNDVVEEFLRNVYENIEEAYSFVLPTNNEQLANVTVPGIHDYGTFDFIIVGAGAAGCVLANRLSEVSNWKILLLEAGGEQTDFSDIPGFAPLLQLSTMNWGYNSTPQTTGCLGMINNSCIAPRGKVLGGSSTINAKMFVRGNREDFNLWAALGNKGWSYDEVLPHFRRIEHVHIPDAQKKYRGFSGELNLNYTDPTVFTGIYLNGMRELGFKLIDYNGESQIGVNQIQSCIKANRSQSAARAFIYPIRESRRNLNVTTNAFVTRVLINNSTKTASGVRFIANGRRHTATASKEVILSAGSINSAQLLMLSGIGPREELERFDIDVILDLPVGQNMQDHVQYSLVLTTNITRYNTSLDSLLVEYLHGHRPYTASYFTDSMGFFNTSDINNGLPDIQQILSVSLGVNASRPLYNFRDDVRRVFHENYDPYSDLIYNLVLLHPRSKGNVTLQSSSPVDFPNINYNYFSDPEGRDIETMYQGILRSVDLLRTEAYRAVNSSVAPVVAECDQHEMFSREYWYCAIRLISSTLYHPTGTTRMGTSTRDSVVSSSLKVHGMRNLRVVDAGIMPEITSGNTVSPTMMIGDRISDVIKQQYKKCRYDKAKTFIQRITKCLLPKLNPFNFL